MTQEHTPSPWKWNWRHDDGVTTSGSVFSEIRKGHAYAVAICPRYQAEEQWAADATLISAAPELLAALIEAREQLEVYEKQLSGEQYNDTRINAAIAKALGEN